MSVFYPNNPILLLQKLNLELFDFSTWGTELVADKTDKIILFCELGSPPGPVKKAQIDWKDIYNLKQIFF